MEQSPIDKMSPDASQSMPEFAGKILVSACHGAAKRAGWWHDLETGTSIVERPHVVGENGKKY
jgi:hypothetical protein